MPHDEAEADQMAPRIFAWAAPSGRCGSVVRPAVSDEMFCEVETVAVHESHMTEAKAVLEAIKDMPPAWAAPFYTG